MPSAGWRISRSRSGLLFSGWTGLLFPLGPVRYREHEVRDVGRSVHGEAGMVILDSDPCRADSVRVTLFVPHLPDGIDYLVEAVDEVADAAIRGFVGVDAVELLGLCEQFSHIAAGRGNLSFALYDLAEGLLEQRSRFGEGAVAVALLDVAWALSDISFM